MDLPYYLGCPSWSENAWREYLYPADASSNEMLGFYSQVFNAVEGNTTRAVIASLLGEPGVATLHDTNGRWDLLAELRAANLSELSQVLERIRLVRGISSTETSIHLQTYRLS